MEVKVLSPKDARHIAWTYNPEGKTQKEQRAQGSSVKGILYSIPEEDQLFGRVVLQPRAHHGKVEAKDTCYYYVLSGTVEFLIYCGGTNENSNPCGKPATGCNPCCGKCTTDRRRLGPNEAIMIKKGTIFDYVANEYNESEVILIRNYA